MAYPVPAPGRIVDFAEFVAARRSTPRDAAGPAEAGGHAAPYLPGFEAHAPDFAPRERPLTAQAVDHRRRMLVHLSRTRQR